MYLSREKGEKDGGREEGGSGWWQAGRPSVH